MKNLISILLRVKTEHKVMCWLHQHRLLICLVRSQIYWGHEHYQHNCWKRTHTDINQLYILQYINNQGTMSLHTFAFPPKACHTLAEVNMYAPIINEHIVHLKVCIFTCLAVLEFHKCILQWITSHLVSYHLTAVTRYCLALLHSDKV